MPKPKQRGQHELTVTFCTTELLHTYGLGLLDSICGNNMSTWLICSNFNLTMSESGLCLYSTQSTFPCESQSLQ